MDNQYGTPVINAGAVTTELPVSLESKLSVLLGEELVGGLVPWKENNYYTTKNTIYFKEEVNEGGLRYSKLSFCRPLADGKFTKADLTNPEKMSRIASPSSMFQETGGEDLDSLPAAKKEARIKEMIAEEMKKDGYYGEVGKLPDIQTNNTPITFPISINSDTDFRLFIHKFVTQFEFIWQNMINTTEDRPNNYPSKRLYIYIDFKFSDKNTGKRTEAKFQGLCFSGLLDIQTTPTDLIGNEPNFKIKYIVPFSSTIPSILKIDMPFYEKYHASGISFDDIARKPEGILPDTEKFEIFNIYIGKGIKK